MVIQVTEDGYQFIHNEQVASLLSPLGEHTSRRASHVLPENPIKRLAFVVLRRVFGEKDRVSDYTRRWRGPWMVDLKPSNGPILRGFENRQDAIAAEVRWLEENVL